MRAVTSILVPTDFSPASQRALAYARDLADAFGASLHILHAIDDPFERAAYMEMYAPPPEYLEGIEQRAKGELDTQLTPDDKVKYSAVLVLRRGKPAHEILEYLKAHGEIDLVVMATAGRGGVARLMMGSVAERVVRAAHCPVLTIHPHDVTDTSHRAA